MQIENVSLIEVIAAARGRHASLVVESTGYLMLGIARAMNGRSAHVDARQVMLSTEGVVVLTGQRKRGEADQATEALHSILGKLLGVSHGVGASLRAIASAEAVCIEALLTGITKSLIPLNRSAAKRALGRLARETVRARNRGQLSAEDLEAAAQPAVANPLCARQQASQTTTDNERALAGDTAVATSGARTPAPREPVMVIPEADDWADIDANIELATPVPVSVLNIELATPTLSPMAVATVDDASLLEVDCALDDLEENSCDDVVDERVVPAAIAPSRAEATAPDDAEDTAVDAAAVEVAASAAELAPSEVAADEVVADEVVADEVVADEVAVVDVAADEVAADEVAADEVAHAELAAAEVVDDEVAADEVAADKVAADAGAVAYDVAVDEVAAAVAHEVAASKRADAAADSFAPVSMSGGQVPFIPVTPRPAIVHRSPLPAESQCGTPTIVDATLYRLTGFEFDSHADHMQERERISALSVQLPLAEPLPVIAEDEMSVEIPLATNGDEVEDGAASNSCAAPGVDDDDAPRLAQDALLDGVPSRKSDIELEAELVERMLADATAGARENRPGSVEALIETFGSHAEADAVTEAAASLKRMMCLDLTPPPAQAKQGGFRLREAEGVASAKRARRPILDIEAADRRGISASVGDRKATPPPVANPQASRAGAEKASVAQPSPAKSQETAVAPTLVAHETAPIEDFPEDQNMERSPSVPPAYDDVCLDVVPSVSPPPVNVIDAEHYGAAARELPRLTPTEMSSVSATAQRALFFGTTVLLAGLFVVGFLYWQHPHTLGLTPDRTIAAGIAGSADEPGPCYAELTLKDLPAPHEVLLRLGQAPFTSGPLPTGVRLELIGLAPGHQPRRIVVPADAEWAQAADGKLAMALNLDLEPGQTNAWPDAPVGEVGGIGPRGTIAFTAKPADAEVWLVAGAGDGDRALVTVPCESTAHILVLNPREPNRRRRLSVEPNMLEAARHAGGAELSVRP